MKTKIAIACQGGGAETAFTAGALHALFEAGIDKEFEIVSLGGHVWRRCMRLTHLVCAPKRRATGVATAARFLDREQSAEVNAGATLQPIYRYVVTNGRQELH